MASASTVIYAKDFEGYIPVIDPRRLSKPCVINGSNWLFDVDGPRSAFASKFANYVQYDNDNKVKVTQLRVDNEIWYGTPKGIFRHDTTNGELQPMLEVSNITKIFWPWSSALCGGKYYFAQYGIGLWQYDPVTNAMTKITTPVADANIKFVTVSYGRLLVLFSGSPADSYMWSALDNGTDFVPSLTTSAGFQTCGLVGGTAYRIDAVADGFIVSTSNGLQKATYVGTNYLWQHRVLSTEIKIFSPNCGAIIPDVGVVLIDRSGMYLSNGAIPTPWEPLMGEYFKKNQLADINTGQFGCVQIVYSTAMKSIFVSFAPSAHEGSFSATFCYLTSSQKWGTFNKTSWGLFDVILPVTGLEYTAYMSFDGYMQYFFESHQCDVLPLAPFTMRDVLWRPQVERYMEVVNGVQTFVGSAWNPNYDPTYYSNLPQLGTYFPDPNPIDDNTQGDFNYEDIPTDATVTPIVFYTNMILYPEGPVFLRPSPYTLPVIGLNSFLELGPFRFTEQMAADETSMLSSVVIGVTPVGAFVSFEDWNVLSGAEDWLAETGFDDWGAGAGIPDGFGLVLTTSNDAFSPGAQGTEDLYIVNNMGGAFMYSPQGWSGIFHKFKVVATEPGQGYAIKYIDLAGMLTGRVTLNG